MTRLHSPSSGPFFFVDFCRSLACSFVSFRGTQSVGMKTLHRHRKSANSFRPKRISNGNGTKPRHRSKQRIRPGDSRDTVGENTASINEFDDHEGHLLTQEVRNTMKSIWKTGDHSTDPLVKTNVESWHKHEDQQLLEWHWYTGPSRHR